MNPCFEDHHPHSFLLCLHIMPFYPKTLHEYVLKIFDPCLNLFNKNFHSVSDGYHALGYQSIHIDDCWLNWNRTSDGKVAANATRFPSGMAALANYVI